MRFLRSVVCRAVSCREPALQRVARDTDPSMPTLEHFTGFELVHRAAVGALALAVVAHIDIDARVAVPQFHVGFGVGAVEIACGVEVVGGQLDGSGGGHDGVSF